MFKYVFSQPPIATFERGSLPRVRRLIRTHDNPTWSYALHVHPDEIELLYIAGGRADIFIEQQVYSVCRGDILLVDKGVPHSTASHSDDPSDIWCLSATNVDFFDAPLDISIAAHTDAGEDRDFIEGIFKQIQALSTREDPTIHSVCDHLCASLIVLYRNLLLQSPATYWRKDKNLARNVFDYINENYNQRIDLDLLSRVFYSSPSHISREFKRVYQMSPINCLIDERLSKAKWLLINTNEPLATVAETVGYHNPYYFTKLFTSRIGYSPSDYRKTYGNKRSSPPE